MKNKKRKSIIISLMGALCGVALLLTGCGPTLTNVDNPSKEIIYVAGGSALSVGGYTYFANGFVQKSVYESATDGYGEAVQYDYSSHSNYSFLARVKQGVVADNGADFSPSNVERVNGENKVAGFQDQDMFIIGQNLYFTSTSTHRNDKNIHNYNNITLWRTALNGGDRPEEIFSTSYFTGGKFAPVGDSQSGYYWICYTGAYNSTADSTAYANPPDFSGKLFSIKVGDGANPSKEIASHVSGVAFPDANEIGTNKSIFYTTSDGVFSIDYAGSQEAKKYNSASETITLVDMIKDKVFFTTTQDSTATYVRDVAGISNGQTFNDRTLFVRNSSISNIQFVCEGDNTYEGYIYTSGGDSGIKYLHAGNTISHPLVNSDSFTDFLFVDGDYVYLSSASEIMRVSIKAVGDTALTPTTIVSMGDSMIMSGEFGYDGKYIYFFSKLKSDVELEEENPPADDNYYMYRALKGEDQNKYQLIGKTLNTRTPKKED